MFRFLDKKRKQQLYEQWVQKSGLPPEEVPKITPVAGANTEEAELGNTQFRDAKKGLYIPIRYILVFVFILAVFLVTTSILATILLMQSC